MNLPVSNSLDAALPPLDMHAHIDPTVTPAQTRQLGTAIIFAVTRSCHEAAEVRSRADDRLLWGAGIHPGRRDALDQFDAERFAALAAELSFVGEVGLDRRVRHPEGSAILAGAIQAAQRHDRLSSVHSTGRHREVLEVIGADARGVVLHWFTGSQKLVARAAEAGAFFSINAAMTDVQINALPPDRVLPETDYPFTKKAGSRLPGDLEVLESRCSALFGQSRDEIRQLWYRNLRSAFTGFDKGLSVAPAVLRRPLATV